ncbi:PRD domain-containing protein [Raineyella fluvialis]|uniref:PRD domain-containing protein n=1 Tax=Raineyella fluvialis TaxID=2662261 RepID=A0A5Q2FD53_9ACTN|nr:PRD domain-containing protein [Raineyella fluvialis]QGF22635.1 PRD domain-containing protein [Raineyella fluvialis]
MPQPQRITKVLNSSVVLVSDDAGRESILLGRGIGYGRKTGEMIDKEVVDRVFLPVDDPDSRALVDLLGSISAAYVLLARDIIAAAQAALQVELHPHLLLALTDHLHFAAERHKQGMRVVNRLTWEMRTYYPDEYRVGTEVLRTVNERLGLDLPEDEATNIAFHLVNARNDPHSAFDALRAATLISELVAIVSYRSGRSLAPTDLDQRRFVVHLQFFADRLFTGRLLDSDEGFLYDQIRTKYPEAIETAHQMRRHVQTQYGLELPDEEVGYLGLHIQRLLSKTTAG